MTEAYSIVEEEVYINNIDKLEDRDMMLFKEHEIICLI